MSRKTFCMLLLALTTLFSGLGLAQDITGSIVGTVRDSSGAVVAHATVTVTNTDTGVVVRNIKTDSAGNYSAPLLPIGHYSVTVESAGFKKSTEKGIVLNVNDKLTVNAALQVGATTETVVVESNPLQVDLQSASATGLVSGQQIRELSLNTRNYEELVTLIPGVASSQSTDQIYVGAFSPVGTNVVSFSIGGARTSENNWTIDGFDNVDRGSNLTLLSFPSVDAIEEFKVVRGAYDPEFGRSGGAQVNVVTRSGTNAIHGAGYEFFRNDVLAANDWSRNKASLPRLPLRYNNFGYNLGGPVLIPGLYNGHDKTFFFFSEEFRRVITYNATATASVPTLAERSGTFAHPVCVAFVGNTCATTGTQIATFSPVASEYLKDIFNKLPLPNDPVDPHLVHLAARNPFDFREEIVKVDHVFGPRLTVNGKYLHDSIPTQEPFGVFNTTGFLPGVLSSSTNSPGHAYSARATSTLSPTLLLEAGYGYSYGAIVSDVTGLALSSNSPDVHVPLMFSSTMNRIPSILFSGGPSGFGTSGGTSPYRDFNTNHTVFGGITKVWGKHTFKTGGVYYHYEKNENSGNGNQGIFSINTSGQPTAGNIGFERTWANFLLGRASNFRQDSVDLTAIIRTQQFEFYGQDEFRFKPNLTVTYGVRYSNFRQPTDANNKLSNFDPKLYDPSKAPTINANGTICTTAPCTAGGTPNPNYDPLNGFVIAGKNSPFGDKVANEDNKNFAPRIGIAWDPFKTGKTSLRGGYGIFYDSVLFGNAENDIFLNPAFNPSVNIPNTTLDNPGNAAAAAPSANPLRVRGLIASPYHTPYVQQWSLDVQRAVGKSFVVDVGYYGSKGTHLLGILDINQPKPDAYLTQLVCGGSNVPPNCIAPGAFVTGATTPLLNRIRPFLGYTGIDGIETIFNSNYNSLQVDVQKRFTGNSFIELAYTWAHSLTDNQTDRSTAPQDSYCIHCDYGPSQQDRRQVLTANYVYNLPFFQSQHGLIGHVAGGWTFSGIATFQTGLPFTVSSPFDADPAGEGCLGPSPCAVRPDLVGDPNNSPHTQLNWFNTTAFAAVPAGQFRNGTAGRGPVIGPGFQRWDLSLYKSLKIKERLTTQLRLEAFNAFNHTNYNAINTSMSSTTFGQVTAARDPRIVQLGLKFNF